ncbi:Putative Thioredoxin [Blastococcus saxobsidens DD2]|uniref:Putative Thioredoxin n=1 Tax=Blastococcus saxobsidens (strain DD2) TaxID=1146883 RepID=H6RJI2_BLASD|nr:Putative Thioredoxin [Blastococcus saxobsidens DD2]
MRHDRRVRGRLLAILAALAVASAACSPGTGSGPASPAGGTVAEGPQQGTAPALAPSGTTLDGGNVDAAELAGTPVVLWFWAPWCTVCRAEAPEVAEVAAEYAGRVEVLGVAGRGELEAMQAFVDETGTGGLRHLVDEDGSLWQRFGVITQPAFVFVTGDGTTESFMGSLGGEQLRAMVEELDRE